MYIYHLKIFIHSFIHSASFSRHLVCPKHHAEPLDYTESRIWWYTPVIPTTQRVGVGEFRFDKRTGGVAQVVQCWPSKQEALSSIPSTAEKEKKYAEERRVIPFLVF
jgi:hypothetical protein